MSDTTQKEYFDIVQPAAAAMIQSLRAFGYDLATAIADLIDNSISAAAKNIWLDFLWDGEESCFVLTDDGDGMGEEQLVRAMRPGSQNPMTVRSSGDLGRYGLGLKTASFSQCKRLTVASRAAGSTIATRCWDLNYVSISDEWRLLHSGFIGIEDIFSKRLAPAVSGTVVVWENLDRLVQSTHADNQQDERRFLEHIHRVKDHISMVFHRFLERPNPIKIWLNDRIIKPWDPFLRNEDATQPLTKEPLIYRGKRITVLPYILPHSTRIDHETHERAAGPKGWNESQGFYVYRNDRLLVAGDWLNLGFRNEEHHKLARILIDIPNTLDADWEIDVKKSRALPPPALRDDLKRIARITRARAVEIYRHRGRVYTRRQGASEFKLVWGHKHKGGKVSYVINRDYPLVRDVLGQARDRTKLHVLLRLLEETVPVPLIIIDHGEQPDKHNTPFESVVSDEVLNVMKEVYYALIASGLSVDDARIELGQTEPFDRYPELLATMPT